MTVEIPLSQGLVAVVDDADVGRVLAAGKWSASVRENTAYATRTVRKADGGKTTIRLHNFLTGWSYVDHVNGNGLDNRRSNLRAADSITNAQNVGRRAHNTSGFKGVTWHRRAGKWMAQIVVSGHRIHLGYFADPTEAAKAYDAAAIEHFAAFARPNFEDER